MGDVMVRTARSPIFSQAHDFTCFVCGADGWLVSQADGIPIHSGGGGFAVRAVLRDFAGEIEPGDVFVLNDPWQAGGNHLPDWVIARPVFAGGRLVAFVCNRAHQSDIGGGAPGTYNPLARDTWQEGVRLPAMKLVARGEVRRDLWRLLLANSRTPELQDGDLRAMLGATRIGAERVAEFAEEVSVDGALALFDGILDHAERRMRAALAACRTGSTRAPTTPTTTASIPATSRCGRASPSRATAPGWTWADPAPRSAASRTAPGQHLLQRLYRLRVVLRA